MGVVILAPWKCHRPDLLKISFLIIINKVHINVRYLLPQQTKQSYFSEIVPARIAIDSEIAVTIEQTWKTCLTFIKCTNSQPRIYSRTLWFHKGSVLTSVVSGLHLKGGRNAQMLLCWLCPSPSDWCKKYDRNTGI